MYNHGYDTSKKASLFLCQWYPLSGLVSTIGFVDTSDNSWNGFYLDTSKLGLYLVCHLYLYSSLSILVLWWMPDLSLRCFILTAKIPVYLIRCTSFQPLCSTSPLYIVHWMLCTLCIRTISKTINHPSWAVQENAQPLRAPQKSLLFPCNAWFHSDNITGKSTQNHEAAEAGGRTFLSFSFSTLCLQVHPTALG